MPTKLDHVLIGGPIERLAKFRQTIKDDEGWTPAELAELPEIGASSVHIANLIKRKGWCVKRWSIEQNRNMNYLVNAKTLAKYANQTKR